MDEDGDGDEEEVAVEGGGEAETEKGAVADEMESRALQAILDGSVDVLGELKSRHGHVKNCLSVWQRGDAAAALQVMRPLWTVDPKP
jgi:hypothetical protein